MSVSDPGFSRGTASAFEPVIEAIKEGKPQAVFLLLAVLIAALAFAVSQWGLVALSLTALALVPVIMVVLVLITVGK
ncbi:hypothetical protein [Marivita hallyeonensis]|uniref:Uncharacterized protein n=1 Tax=Marivita hallyeonensis TaxID=996342 RepID=A0A1M5W9U3_9RHOB|nr:hypothetical protein [Marivita hallyeonensis]SHH83983.1 hypothetical protein SAMN05443551_3325 [Marivita hallyeonensis]